MGEHERVGPVKSAQFDRRYNVPYRKEKLSDFSHSNLPASSILVEPSSRIIFPLKTEALSFIFGIKLRSWTTFRIARVISAESFR